MDVRPASLAGLGERAWRGSWCRDAPSREAIQIWAEHWTVGVTVHHLASALEPVAGIVSTIASGRERGQFTRAMLDEMNARHAQEHAHCTQAETIALLRKGAAVAAAVVRSLHDEQLAQRGTVFTDAPPMTVEQLISSGLIGHIDAHIGSIRKTVGT